MTVQMYSLCFPSLFVLPLACPSSLPSLSLLSSSFLFFSPPPTHAAPSSANSLLYHFDLTALLYIQGYHAREIRGA